MISNHNREKDNENPLLKNYFKDLKKHPPLSREEEVVLLEQVKAGNERAKQRLILANLRFVVAVAKRYKHINEVPFEELIAVGNLGLMRAAQRFDCAKNVRFISYAVWWIRQAMIQVVSSHANPIRLPLNRVHTSLKLKKLEESLTKKLNRKPTLEELAESAMMRPADLQRFIRDIPASVATINLLAVDFCINPNMAFVDPTKSEICRTLWLHSGCAMTGASGYLDFTFVTSSDDKASCTTHDPSHNTMLRPV